MSEKKFLVEIKLDVAAESKAELFSAAAELLIKAGIADDREKIIAAFFEREEIGGTLNYPGLAIPHTTGNFITRDTILFLRTKEPIQNWQDDYPAQNFICLCLGENPHTETLKQIENLMRLSLKPEGEKIFLYGNSEQLTKIFLS